MATDDFSGRNPPGNPTITDIEAANVGVRPEFDLNAVELEVTDQDGAGFRALLGWEQGMDLALRLAVAVTAVARHRDYRKIDTCPLRGAVLSGGPFSQSHDDTLVLDDISARGEFQPMRIRTDRGPRRGEAPCKKAAARQLRQRGGFLSPRGVLLNGLKNRSDSRETLTFAGHPLRDERWELSAQSEQAPAGSPSSDTSEPQPDGRQ